jgi:hypothetical protein
VPSPPPERTSHSPHCSNNAAVEPHTQSSPANARSTALVHSGGMAPGRGANVIPVGDKEFLLTVTSGDAVHLSREAGPDETPRSAVPGWHLRRGRMSSPGRWRAYNRAILAEPRWAETTLCGRHWIAMADDEDGDAGEPGGGAFIPTCRRCLAIMDKLFPEPPRPRGSRGYGQTPDRTTSHAYADAVAPVLGHVGDLVTGRTLEPMANARTTLASTRPPRGNSGCCRFSMAWINMQLVLAILLRMPMMAGTLAT